MLYRSCLFKSKLIFCISYYEQNCDKYINSRSESEKGLSASLLIYT